MQKKILSDKANTIYCLDTLRPITEKVCIKDFNNEQRADIEDIHADPYAFRQVVDVLSAYFKKLKINKLVAIAARGMPFGVEIANKLNIPYAIIGKGGKMPGVRTMRPAYIENYHQEKTVLEMLPRHINAGDRVGIVDDRIYSGAQMIAAAEILNNLKAKVLGIASLTMFDDKFKASRACDMLQNISKFSYLHINKKGRITIDDTFSGEKIKAVKKSWKDYSIKELKDLVYIYPDFPQEGIMWTDFSGVQLDPLAYKSVVRKMADHFSGINKVVSLAVRGIDFGASVANYLGIPHVIAGKIGGLPLEPITTMRFEMEYDEATIGLPNRLIRPGDKILMVDDIVATAGTMKAGHEIIKALGADVVGATSLIGLTDVMHRSKAWNELFKQKSELYTILDFTNKELVRKYWKQARLS